MTTCCCAGKPTAQCETRCPECGSQGTAVELRTVKALLTESALTRLTPSEFRFCPDSACDVVYFGADATRFNVADVRVPVWQKLPSGDRTLCYCFGESETSVRAEIDASGRSLASERIREHIAAGRCACDVRNPKGSCCLGDVITMVARLYESAANGSGR
jgi:hypothetical protein